MVFILAIKDIGANQHLSIIRGVERGSVASPMERWCQVVDRCVLSRLRLSIVIIKELIIEVDQTNLIGRIQVDTNADREEIKIYIIN